MILSHFADFRRRTFKKTGEIAARVNTATDQNQRAKQRQNCLFAGQHHHTGFAQLTEGVQRNETTQILGDFQRPGDGHRAHVRGPEQIAVRCFVHLFQRILQLPVGDFQLGQFQQ